MNKTTILTATIILLAGLTSAAQVNPETLQKMNITPEGENTTTYDVILDSEDNYVNAQADNTGQFSVSFVGGSYLDNDGEITVEVNAPETANTKKNITLMFQGEREEGNSTESFEIERYIVAETRDPYEERFSGWVNTSQYFQVDGTSYNISNIESSLFLNEGDIQVEQDEQEMIGNIRLTLLDTLPPENYAKVVAETQEESTEFDVKTRETSQDETCKLFLSTQGGTTIQRGSVFYFQTVKEGTQESVGATYVRLENSQTGELIGDDTTNNYGYGQIQIPETLGANNTDQTIQVVAKVQKEDSPCDPSRRTLQPNTPYGEYIQNNDEFQLQTEITSEKIDRNTTPSTLYGNLTGTVTTADGENIDTGVIVVEQPSGQRTDFSFEDGDFNYKPSSDLGEYRFKASKTNYADSPWQTVDYQDECPDIEGTVEANGCLAQEIDLRYFTANENGETEQVNANELQPGTTYVLRVFNEEGEVDESFDESMSIENEQGASDSIQFDNGVARYQWPEGEESTYDISYSDSGRYEGFDDSIQVQNQSVFSDFSLFGFGLNQIAATFIVVLLVFGGIIYYTGKDNQSSTGKNQNVKVEHGDIGGIGSNGGNSPNLQNQDIGKGDEN